MDDVPTLDQRLDRVLRDQAARAGETVDTYVQGAVLARLRRDVAASGDPTAGPLLDLLDQLAGEKPLASVTVASHPVLDDPARLAALRATGLLDSEPEGSYDRIVALAVAALDVPAAAVSLVDDHRQFFKSAHGLAPNPDGTPVRETPLSRSVCRYAVAQGEPLIVEDARTDALLSNHPAVLDGTLVAYAGIPLFDPEGLALGTLCVWDTKPRQWSTGHVQTLDDLAKIITDRLFGEE